MSKLKKIIKEDFINKTDVSFTFDTAILEDNVPIPKKPFNKKWLFLIIPTTTVASLVLVIAGVVLSTMLVSRDSVKVTRKRYSAQEIAVIESNTFKRLNTVAYPALTGARYTAMNENEKEAYNAFANALYQSLDYEENTAFAPVNLYPLLSLVAMGNSTPELNASFNELFTNMNDSSRTTLYQKIFKNNYYHNENGTSLLHNGAFLDKEFEFDSNYLSKLTANYFEAFNLDYTSEVDINKMLAWIDETMQEDGFIKKADLKLTEETMLYFFSSFIFSNEWQSKYYESMNKKDLFYLADGRMGETTYMRHSYNGVYYDYDKYVSVYDYYTNGNSVQYIVPKAHTDNIYDLLGSSSFLVETGERHEQNIIELTAPIFTSSNTINFKDSLTRLGLGSMFDKTKNNFGNMFKTPPLYSYIQEVRQKNVVSFTVDGTKIKSLAFAGAGSTSVNPGGTLQVKLNQPFIYVIRDINSIPLFIGHYDTPLT